MSAAFRLSIGVDISNPLRSMYHTTPYVPPQSPWLPFKPNITLLVDFCHNICHFSPCFELGLYSWSNRLLANEVIRSETLVTPQAEGQGGIRPCLFDHKYNYKPFLPCFYCFSLAWYKELKGFVFGWLGKLVFSLCPPSALLILLQMHLARVFEAKSK